jgi:hypothetical protein
VCLGMMSKRAGMTRPRVSTLVGCPDPDIRVRKLMGYWTVQRRIIVNNHVVWSYVASYSSWPIAYAVATVEASPDEWPFHKDWDYHMEACS